MALEDTITELIASNNAMAQAMEGKADEIDAATRNQEQKVEQFLQNAKPEMRWEQEIHIGGSKDKLYPVWFRFPGNEAGGGNLTICRTFSKDSERHPLAPNIPHQAALLLQLEGNAYPWSGDANFMEIKRFAERYNSTLSHTSFAMYAKADLHPGIDQLYTGASHSFSAQCLVFSGVYLRGGGLTYKVIKNWPGNVSFHDGSDDLRRELSRHQQDGWGVVWYAEPIPFSALLQPEKTVNSYVDMVVQQ